MKFTLIIAFALLVVSHLISVPTKAETTLRIGLASLPNGNGNPFSSSARTSWYTYRALFDTLTQLGPGLAIKPGLATSWHSVDDYTWMVTVREGINFSNGEVLDAEAIIFSYRYLKSDEGTRDSLSRDVEAISAIEAIGSHIIQFSTSIPIPQFPRLMAVIPIVAPAHWQEVGREGFTFDPVGTGPFRLTAWKSTQLLFDAYKESWRPPQLDTLEILSLPEASARVAALITDRIDVASEIGPDDALTIEAAGMNSYQRPATASQVMAFNTIIESPLQDVRVRQALNYAVNKDVISTVIMDGRANVVDQLTPAINTDRHPNLAPYPYDPDKARTLLAEAGYENGFSFVFEFSFGTGPRRGC